MSSSVLWIRDIQAGGGAEAWSRLYQRHGPELIDYARTVLGNHMQARLDPEDLCQKAFMRAIPRFLTLKFVRSGTFVRLLKVTILRVAMDEGRLKGHRKQSPTADLGSAVLEAAKRERERSPASLMAMAEDLENLRAAIRKLPRLYREVLTALDIEQQDPRQVAMDRAVSSDTLRRQRNRGRKLLLERLYRRG